MVYHSYHFDYNKSKSGSSIVFPPNLHFSFNFDLCVSIPCMTSSAIQLLIYYQMFFISGIVAKIYQPDKYYIMSFESWPLWLYEECLFGFRKFILSISLANNMIHSNETNI